MVAASCGTALQHRSYVSLIFSRSALKAGGGLFPLGSFEYCAVASLQTTPQIDENYFIVSGAAAAQGVVIARGRNKADDVWPLNSSETDGWFRLQTNYDHWNPPPVADDRRTPGVAMMKALGAGGVNVSSTWDVIKAFPVFNPHTDYSVVMVPATGYYSGIVWMG